MRAFANVVCGVILTDEQVAALKKANGGYLPDCTVMAAGAPGIEKYLVGTCLAFTETPEFKALVSTDMAAMRKEAEEAIFEFYAAWGHVVKLDADKIGFYLGLELLPDRTGKTTAQPSAVV